MTKPVPKCPASSEAWLIPRSSRSLLELPVDYRWEVTRRHPYYLRFWELAHRFRHQPSSGPTDYEREKTASLVLLAIGVTGDPFPPGTRPEALDAAAACSSWQHGAVAPLSFRALAHLLVLGLPGEARAAVGRFLIDSAGADVQSAAQLFPLLQQLQALGPEQLDEAPQAPIVGINLQAPQRLILEATEKLVRQWKQEQDIAETRRRDDKLNEYLNVWDRREGWAGDRYDSSQEQTLRQIAQAEKLPLSTIANRYRSAFRLIVGRDYSPDLWARVIGFLKLAEWFDPGAVPKRSSHRPWRQRQPRDVPETVLGSATATEQGGLLNTIGIAPDETAYTDLVIDLQDLIASGRSNEAIARELELHGPATLELIQYYRERHADQL